ncbi:hypothetical protein [Streptomyces telluris]|uniref:Secreted protein n=1 Tax=Streptomyces telluris TaxID=2720021 RepID=A0A9X2LNH4_9ACTN|nr:hypothetical protein [Streptomyces telluris]MCQ8774400.1 hypothetical protein [Streptomyces telluris]NJP82474.1 hypothetical protein [Streptomyces telluris]
MSTRCRVAAVSLSLALAGGGAVGVAAPASASAPESTVGASTSTAGSAFSCDAWQYERGTRGHGASITCYGSSFTAYAVCHRPDGSMYLRLGHRARSGGISIVWCGLDAEVSQAGAFPV